MVATSDGGFIISTVTKVGSLLTKYKAVLMRVDSTGLVDWSVVSNDIDIAMTTLQTLVTPSGDVLLTGSCTKPNSVIEDTFVFKITSLGSNLWLKTYGFSTQSLNNMKMALIGDEIVLCSILERSGSIYMLIVILKEDGDIR